MKSIFKLSGTGSNKNKLHSKIKSFEIVTLHMSGMQCMTEHEMVMKDGKAEISRYGIGFTQDKVERILEKRAVCDEAAALELLNRCTLLSWDGFDGPHPKGVKDGTMFTLKATVNGDKQIRAAGSHNFPKHFWDFTNGLYELLSGEKTEQR